MEGMEGMGVGCDFEHPLRASHASPSRSEGEEDVLVWPAGVLQVLGVRVGVPPLSFGHFPRERGQP